MSAEVFISYAAKDRERVAKLVEGLQQAGVSVWIDMAGIEVAAMWSKEIVSAIRECKVLLLSISPQSTESENVVKELALASERKKPIIPIYLEPAEIPETMEYQLAGIQRVEFYKGREEMALQAVIRALAKLGVAVADEASAAAAGIPNIAAHSVSHSSTRHSTANEGAAWGKIVATLGGITVLAAGLFFLAGSSSETTIPLDQSGTNTVTQAKPLAKPATLDTNRVVVLPFKVIGSMQDSKDLGYGLVSTLTSKLQPLQNLVVIAKESARKFEDSTQTPREIGQALGAGTIVTGEIQTSSNRIQVNIQLIDANTEALGWGSTFTKNKDEFLDQQNEIATKLASELKGGLDAVEAQQLAQKATENPEAQAEYQAGRREWNKRSKKGFDKAIKHFEKAIELDPSYADPYAGLADTYGLLPGYNLASPSDAMPKAKTYAEEAINLNPNLASAYTSIAWVQNTYDYDWTKAKINYEKAIQLNPNYATGNHWYGLFLTDIGRTEDSIETMLKAAQLDPTSKIIKHSLSITYWIAKQNTLALSAINEALKIDPFFPLALHTKYSRIQANPKTAIEHLTQALEVYPNQPTLRHTLFDVHWRNGNREKAKDQLIELLDKYHNSFRKGQIAKIYFLMDKTDDGYRWLQKSIELRESFIFNLPTDPNFEELRKQPRFREFFKKINHPLYVD